MNDERRDRMPKLGRVLVIDDEVDMLENCARLLTRFGYEAMTEAESGKATTLYERERPDLVLTDLRMPGHDGLGVLQAIRAIDPEATVILITAFATIETAVEAIKEGAFDYLPSRFRPISSGSVSSGRWTSVVCEKRTGDFWSNLPRPIGSTILSAGACRCFGSLRPSRRWRRARPTS